MVLEKIKLPQGCLAFVLFIGGAFALYVNTFGNAWTMDDFPVIVENPDVRSLAVFFLDSHPGRPLREGTYLLDYYLFGLDPWGYHFQNIFWHGFNAFLIFILIVRLKGSLVVAWVASSLFLFHPLAVEVVANVSHRKDSLALAFILLSVHAYVSAFRMDNKHWFWILLSIFLMCVATLGKQNAIVLPVIFLAYEFSFVPKGKWIFFRGIRVWVGLLVFGSVAGILFLLLGEGRQMFLRSAQGLLNKMNHFGDWTGWDYYGLVLKSWSFMFLKVVFPDELAMEYTYGAPSSWMNPWVILTFVGIFLYVFVGFRLKAQNPLAFFFLAWVGVFWLPVSNLWPLAYFSADRYLYVPSVGAFVLFALLFERIFTHRKGGLLVVVLVLNVLLGCLTWQQSKVWSSPESLWSQAANVSPQSAFALNNMGNVYFEKGDLDRAVEYYQQAAKYNPYNPTTQFNLGLIFEKKGQMQEALGYFRNFLAINDPAFKEQRGNLRSYLRLHYGVRANGE